MYSPLPSFLTIKPSEINGIGLFTQSNLSADTDLGMSHLELGKLILRTPLGGFINHANDSNCIKSKSLLTRQEWNHLSDLPNTKYDHNFPKWHLITLKDVKAGEELTVRYTLYKI